MFNLNDSKLFNLSGTKSGIDKIKLNLNGECQYPFVTRTEKSNGIDSLVPIQEKSLNQGNTISIGLDTQTVFYQEKPYYSGQNIQVFEVFSLSKELAMFLIPIIKNQLKYLNWGGNGATLSRLRAKKILLPCGKDGSPDWKYMEQYIVNIMKAIKVPELEPIKSSSLDLHSARWEEFEIKQIFKKITSVKGKPIGNYPSGKIPYITTSAMNNGLTNYISADKQAITKKNVITIDPIKGKLFYHNYDFVGRGGAGSAINVLEGTRLTKNIGLFLITAIESNSTIKASYGIQLNGNRLRNQKIMLPATDEGTPDWQFMEDYIRSISNSNLI
ncbi:restriction endonuclease subunit S [Listeria monocytogenes]|uniref:restriction endonuclease subunit S n=1 Tax=Listeria monocytogenes TaxID=1639 RepID=UPI002473FDA4|nr:restriction endonuclease subunit S [Listeria monocytogenes]WKN67230.1 restriction endonuclease subunit S [Listeria monocytogenes]WKN73034.1 restriction endonuclease subunit S [Listeria monocytogenes]